MWASGTIPGSVLVAQGRTMVLCTATVEDRVPQFLEDSGRGWLTAEYAMLPGSTSPRKPRDFPGGRGEGRAREIQRLIGRSLRAAVDLSGLGPRTIWIDCDVLRADGGTRAAALNGAAVALADAARWMLERGLVTEDPVRTLVAAVGVGLVDGQPLLDLEYSEDSRAEVDMNVVQAADGRLIEVQAAAEGRPFSRAELDRLLALAAQGAAGIFAEQRRALGGAAP